MRRLAFLAAASLALGVAAFNQPAADAFPVRRPKSGECACYDMDGKQIPKNKAKICVTPEGSNKDQEIFCNYCLRMEYVNTGFLDTKPNYCKR